MVSRYRCQSSTNAISSITITAVSALVPMMDIGKDEIEYRCATVDANQC